MRKQERQLKKRIEQELYPLFSDHFADIRDRCALAVPSSPDPNDRKSSPASRRPYVRAAAWAAAGLIAVTAIGMGVVPPLLQQSALPPSSSAISLPSQSPSPSSSVPTAPSLDYRPASIPAVEQSWGIRIDIPKGGYRFQELLEGHDAQGRAIAIRCRFDNGVTELSSVPFAYDPTGFAPTNLRGHPTLLLETDTAIELYTQDDRFYYRASFQKVDHIDNRNAAETVLSLLMQE